MSVRRPLARALLGRFAPRIDDGMTFDEAKPWIVVGFLTSPSGLGQSARLAYGALLSQGREVYGVDISEGFLESAGVVDFRFRDGRGVLGRGNVLINVNPPYVRHAQSLIGARLLRGKAVLAYWVWETERAPKSWKDSVACVHAIAAPSLFAARAIEAMAAPRRVSVVPHPVALGRLPPIKAPDDGAPFTILSMCNAASGFERKNPVALVRAFRCAFGDDPSKRLRLRVTNLDQYPPGEEALRVELAGARNIEFTTRQFGDADWAAWWDAPHLYGSLHRAEGFSLPIAEAMCAGVPALATAWSGNIEYMSDENSYLVRAPLVSIQDAQKKYAVEDGFWADPDIEHAAALLREASENRVGLRERAAAARQTALAHFSRFDLTPYYAGS